MLSPASCRSGTSSRNGKNVWENERKAVPNRELKGMVEFYKTASREQRPREYAPEL